MSAYKRSSSKPLASILASAENGLQPLFARAHRLQALNHLLRAALGEPLGPHVNLSNIRDNTAVVTADSSAWLTQLRFQAPIVLHILRSQTGLETLRKIHFKVQPAAEAPPSRLPPRRASLSQGGAQTLESAAATVQDPDLAAALRRLARQGPTKR